MSSLTFRVASSTLPGVFLFRLTLFCFTFVHTAVLKKSNFLNDFFLSLLVHLRDKIFIIRDLTPLNKNDFCTFKLKFSLRSKELICVIKVPNKEASAE